MGNDPVDWVDPWGNVAAAAAVYLNPTSYVTPAGWIALGIVTLGVTIYEVHKHWDEFGGVCYAKEHTKNQRPSNLPKHEKGNSRRKRDRGGEKGDSKRGYPRKKPNGWKGPWPPLN